MRTSPRRFWKSRSRSSILNGAGAASGRAPEQRLCRCPHSKRARLKPRPRLGLGFGLGVVAPPSPPSFCQFPPSSQPRKLYCPDGFSTLCHSLVSMAVCACVCVWLALCRLSCVCVFVRRCAIGYVVCERSQMGLESFYLGVKTAIFSSRGSAPHPAGGRPPDPRVRPQRPQNLELGYRQKSPLPVRPRKKGRCRC